MYVAIVVLILLMLKANPLTNFVLQGLKMGLMLLLENLLTLTPQDLKTVLSYIITSGTVGLRQKFIFYCSFFCIKTFLSRHENIIKADHGQKVGISVSDCRIYHDGSTLQAQR